LLKIGTVFFTTKFTRLGLPCGSVVLPQSTPRKNTKYTRLGVPCDYFVYFVVKKSIFIIAFNSPLPTLGFGLWALGFVVSSLSLFQLPTNNQQPQTNNQQPTTK
jgi:hypothetical protein